MTTRREKTRAPLPACLLRGPGSRGTKCTCNSQCRVTQRKHSNTRVTQQERRPSRAEGGERASGRWSRGLEGVRHRPPPFCTRAAISPLRELERGDLRAPGTWRRSRVRIRRCPGPAVSPHRRARRQLHSGGGVRTSAAENTIRPPLCRRPPAAVHVLSPLSAEEKCLLGTALEAPGPARSKVMAHLVTPWRPSATEMRRARCPYVPRRKVAAQ